MSVFNYFRSFLIKTLSFHEVFIFVFSGNQCNDVFELDFNLKNSLPDEAKFVKLSNFYMSISPSQKAPPPESPWNPPAAREGNRFMKKQYLLESVWLNLRKFFISAPSTKTCKTFEVESL